MKLLNELISIHRIDDDETDDKDQDFDYKEPDSDEDEMCPRCEMDPCTCDHEDDISDDMGKLDDKDSDDGREEHSGDYGYDEFDLPAEDDIYPSEEYDVENEELNAYEQGWKAFYDGAQRVENPHEDDTEDSYGWDVGWADAETEEKKKAENKRWHSQRYSEWENEEDAQSSYDLGYEAFERGQGQEANPFDKGTDEYAEWMTAWNDARSAEHEPYEMSDVEADADTLANAGWGTDEDYGYYGGEDEESEMSQEEKYEQGYRDGFKRKPMASRDPEYRLGYEDGRAELEGGSHGSEDEEDDFYTDKNWRERYGDGPSADPTDPYERGSKAFRKGDSETECPYKQGSDGYAQWMQGFSDASEEQDERFSRQPYEDDFPTDKTWRDRYGLEDEGENCPCPECGCDPCRCDNAVEDEDEGTQRVRFVLKDVSTGNYIMTVRTNMATMDPKIWWTKNPANAGKVDSAEQGAKDIAYLMRAVPGMEGRELKVVKVAVPAVSAYEVEDEETDTKRQGMRNFRKCPMCGMQHGMFDECPMHGEEDEDEDMIRGQMGAYGQQGAHMNGEKDTDTMKTDYDPDAADELDLGDETGDNGSETEDGEGKKLDALADKATEDPDKQGVIRTVKGAHLIYKRQTEDGTYEELWIYNTGNMRDELAIRKAVLAGTDIPTDKTASPDGSQQYELWSQGNAEMIQIKGLPN